MQPEQLKKFQTPKIIGKQLQVPAKDPEEAGWYTVPSMLLTVLQNQWLL